MSSKDMALVSSHRPDNNNNNIRSNNGLNSQLLFPDDDAIRFNCGSSTHHRRDPGPKTRELTGFIDDKMFGGVAVDREQIYFQSHQQMSDYRRSMCGNTQQSGSDESEEGGDEEDDTDELDDDEGFVHHDCNNNTNNNNTSSDSVHSIGVDKIGGDTVSRHHSSLGSSMEVITKDGNTVQSLNNIRESPGENHQQVRATHYQNANGESDGDMYYSQFVHDTNGASQGKRDRVLENGRKDVPFFNESGNSLKTILSDPLTGALMDDAVILPCGHSFGGGGIQHVLKMRACYTCSQPISEESVQPNLSLRSAVLAFRREEELRSHHLTKRRREKFEDKGTCNDSSPVETSRGRGVQFPFVVTDRVVIKGNKRTPERFVGREAVVTTQCLNGWYVVKTLDNAESVKLQYRSLAKVADNPSSKLVLNKITPNWL